MNWPQLRLPRISEWLYSIAFIYTLLVYSPPFSIVSNIVYFIGGVIYQPYLFISNDLFEFLCRLSQCRAPPKLSDELGATGMYVQPSGHILILRPSKQYELCNATDCVTGAWLERKIPPSDDPDTVYPEMRTNIILKNIFKSPAGLQLALDQAYDQFNNPNMPRTAKYLREFKSSYEYTQAMVITRAGGQSGTQPDMISGIGYRYDDYTMPGLNFGFNRYYRDNVIVKFASF